ncbi:MAG TPA: N-formylglutamate amidohydrolase [Candidatus Cloacimonadota bacterium]|nr:N-formylglutamate amidohydrolase [Candidatus Cloacimonadota bacterium]
MSLAKFEFDFGCPIVCTAIHNGHEVSDAVERNLAISETRRLYEEDPFTERFAAICSNQIIAVTSRFEVDLNRSVDKCIYLQPADAWGLQTRLSPPSDEVMETSRKHYFHFYEEVRDHFRKMEDTFGRFFVWDIHSYNHHRLGPDAPFDDPQQNPDVMLGLSNMPARWYPLVEKVERIFTEADYFGKSLFATTKCRFPGGNFSRWIHHNFPDSACCIAIEFKKIWMDEWTGQVFPEKQERLSQILAKATQMIEAEIGKL